MKSKKRKSGPVGRERVSVLVRVEPEVLNSLGELAVSLGVSRNLLIERSLRGLASASRSWSREDLVELMIELHGDVESDDGRGYELVDTDAGCAVSDKRSRAGFLYDVISKLL